MNKIVYYLLALVDFILLSLVTYISSVKSNSNSQGAFIESLWYLIAVIFYIPTFLLFLRSRKLNNIKINVIFYFLSFGYIMVLSLIIKDWNSFDPLTQVYNP